MADVTLTFAAKDAGFAAAMQRMQSRLAAFNSSMGGVAQMSAKVRTSFSGLTRSVLGLGAAYLGVSQAIASFNKALDFSGQMADLSDITGESAGNLAVLERAFANTDIGGDRMLPMLSRMTEFVQQLGKGQGEAVATANMLGVSLNDLKGKTPIQQFETLLKAIARLPDETARLTASGDVFGNRLGGKLIPLANNFNGELDKARTQLGSLVGILDKNAQNLDELGDTLKNSVGNKLTELTYGFLTSVQGANDLADAMSRIDAAGAGIDLGKMFSGAMKSPEQAFVAAGEVLLLGVLKAGNALINATMHAARVYADALGDVQFWNGVGNIFAGVLGRVVNFFTRSLLSGIKTAIFEPLAKLPSLLGGGIYQSVVNQIEKVQGFFDREAQDFNDTLLDGANKVGRALSESMKTVPMLSQDYLGAGRQAKEVNSAFGRLRQLGGSQEQLSQSNPVATGSAGIAPATSQELNQIYNQQIQKLRESNLSASEFAVRLKELNSQMYQAMQQNVVAPPTQQLADEAMFSANKENIQTQEKAQTAQQGKQPASESTLAQAVKYLEQLNRKLPQPAMGY